MGPQAGGGCTVGWVRRVAGGRRGVAGCMRRAEGWVCSAAVPACVKLATASSCHTSSSPAPSPRPLSPGWRGSSAVARRCTHAAVSSMYVTSLRTINCVTALGTWGLQGEGIVHWQMHLVRHHRAALPCGALCSALRCALCTARLHAMRYLWSDADQAHSSAKKAASSVRRSPFQWLRQWLTMHIRSRHDERSVVSSAVPARARRSHVAGACLSSKARCSSEAKNSASSLGVGHRGVHTTSDGPLPLGPAWLSGSSRAQSAARSLESPPPCGQSK